MVNGVSPIQDVIVQSVDSQAKLLENAISLLIT